MNRFRKALVTGGAGFIGSHIAARLIERGIDVNVVDDLSVGNVSFLPKGATFFQGSILEGGIVGEALAGVDVVFHNAARVSIRNSFSDVYSDAETNILGTVRLLKECGKARIKRFIYASSMAVYGDGSPLPVKESARAAPISPYGAGKLAAEAYTSLMSGHWGFDYVILRYFNTFGPRQTFTPYVGVITIFITNILQGRPPVVFGDGTQKRDFVYVGDVAEANILAMETKAANRIFNIGSGTATSVNEIASLVIERVVPGCKPVYSEARPGEPKNSLADITAARALLGFNPKATLKDKIDTVIEWNKGVLDGR